MLQFRVFMVPATDERAASEELNRFLAGSRILNVHREFVSNGSASFWSFCVEYLAGAPFPTSGRKDRVDYKETLTAEHFAVFSRLRECRKRLAQAEGLPAFAVCTDEQLAALAKMDGPTKERLRQVDGIGEAKAEKYGDELLAAHAGKGRDEPAKEDA